MKPHEVMFRSPMTSCIREPGLSRESSLRHALAYRCKCLSTSARTEVQIKHVERKVSISPWERMKSSTSSLSLTMGGFHSAKNDEVEETMSAVSATAVEGAGFV